MLATSNDPVRLSFLTALLADAGIAAIVLDAHTSAVEGSIGAIPRRLVVAAKDEARARHVLRGGRGAIAVLWYRYFDPTTLTA